MKYWIEFVNSLIFVQKLIITTWGVNSQQWHTDLMSLSWKSKQTAYPCHVLYVSFYIDDCSGDDALPYLKRNKKTMLSTDVLLKNVHDLHPHVDCAQHVIRSNYNKPVCRLKRFKIILRIIRNFTLYTNNNWLTDIVIIYTKILWN